MHEHEACVARIRDLEAVLAAHHGGLSGLCFDCDPMMKQRAAGRERGEPERLNAECPDLPGHETHTPPCGTFSRLYDAAAAKPAALDIRERFEIVDGVAHRKVRDGV